MAGDPGNIPKWFNDFAVKNADEHGLLAEKIANLGTESARAETRLTRWTAGIVLGGLTVAVTVTIVVLNALDK